MLKDAVFNYDATGQLQCAQRLGTANPVNEIADITEGLKVVTQQLWKSKRPG